MPGRRGELASHSEQRAYRDLRGSVRPGDRVYLFGERAACPTCRGVLNQWYREMGGQSRFIYIRPGLPPWEANGGRGYLRGDR